MRYRSRAMILGLALILIGGAIAPVSAQGIGNRIRQRAQQKVEDRAVQRAGEGVDKALDKAEGAIVCSVTDKKCIEKAEKSGQQVRLTDAEGNVVGHSAAEAAAPGSKAWANYDFIPGERVIFAEDFTADRVGNFPRRLDMILGNMEVVEWQGKRWLRSSGRSTLVIPLPEVLPERFTMELDLTLNWNGTVISFGPRDRSDIDDTFLFNSTWHENYVVLSGTTAGVQGPRREGGSVVDPRRYVGHDPEGTMVRLRIDADGKYVKVYMNENRVANWPNANISRTNQIHVDIAAFNAEDREMLIGNISVNAGGQTMYDALLADGRFATQGILFDTGSDRIRPESTPTLKEIGEMLKTHSDLRILIEGHTDNVGNAASNQALSEKRAAAVKAFLEKEYKIKGDRLEAQGFGDTKPAAKNDTPEGRQSNRRVELVKL